MAHQRIDARKTSAYSGAFVVGGLAPARLGGERETAPQAVAVARAEGALVLAELPFEAPLGALPEASLPMTARLLGYPEIETTARSAHLARDSVYDAETRVAESISEDIFWE